MEPRLLNVINSYCITFGFQGVTSSNTKLNWRDIWGDVKVSWELSEKAINVLPPNPPPPQLEDKMAIIIMVHFMFNGTCSLGTKWTNKKVSFPSIVNDECLTYFKTLSLGWAHCHAARPDLPIMMECLSHQRILRIVASAVQTHGTSFTGFLDSSL